MKNKQFTVIGKFEVVLLNMAIVMVNDYQLAPNIIKLAKKLYWGQRLKCKNRVFGKIAS